MGKRNPVIMVMDAGCGDTPVPPDAFVQPGETLTVGREDRGGEVVDALVVGVVPVGVPVEYAIADQAKPKQPRPLMLRDREPHTETLYAIQFPDDDEPRLFPHSAMAAGYEKARHLSQRTQEDETA